MATLNVHEDSPAAPALSVFAPAVEQAAEPLSEPAVVASRAFVGKWNHLISTTNWEKGRIIQQWREALIAGGVLAAEYSDEAWSHLVGGVTGQHVGRLRRVFTRFGVANEQYSGLFWSHFQAAIDWNDAEMWLEGAVQSGWSVAQMRNQRWETLGRIESERPRESEVVAAETDEDADPSVEKEPPSLKGEYAEVQGPLRDGPDFGDDDSSAFSSAGADSQRGDAEPSSPNFPPVDLVRPFENLPQLPDDLADAFETFKLALLHHKAEGWTQVPCADVLRTLDALKALALAPSSAEAPF